MDRQELFEDFQRALIQLAEALELPADNDVMKAGCIQYFEFSFELAWKTVKRFGRDGRTLPASLFRCPEHH